MHRNPPPLDPFTVIPEYSDPKDLPDNTPLPRFENGYFHAAVFGGPGSGKTAILKLFLRRIRETNKDDSVWWAAFHKDPSADERADRFFPLRSQNETEGFLDAFEEELRQRQKCFDKVNVQTYPEYLKMETTGIIWYRRLPYLYILADDLERALSSDPTGDTLWRMRLLLCSAPHLGVSMIYTKRTERGTVSVRYNTLPD